MVLTFQTHRLALCVSLSSLSRVFKLTNAVNFLFQINNAMKVYTVTVYGFTEQPNKQHVKLPETKVFTSEEEARNYYKSLPLAYNSGTHSLPLGKAFQAHDIQ